MSEEKKKEILEHAEELDENELKTVAGGSNDCPCPIGGNGEYDDLKARLNRNNNSCGCPFGGDWGD